jgi:hypothetical protein
MFIELDCDDSRFNDFDSTAKTYFFHYINKNALSKKQIIKYSFILMSVFVGRCAECKNVHSVSYIQRRLSLCTFIYILTVRNYLLTPWSRALLETLTGSQLVKKLPAF